MAKHSMLMGTARGKLGNMVLSRVDGVQITRAYNPIVSNPKTVGQATQRAIFATISYMAAVLTAIIDNSFDGFKNGRKSRQAFVKKNLDYVRSKLLAGEKVYLLPKGEKLPIPADFIVSDGKLASSPVSNMTIGTGIYGAINIVPYTNTDEDIVLRLTDLQSWCPDIKPGSQLTFVSIQGDGDRYNMTPKFARIVLGSWITAETEIFNFSAGVIRGEALDKSKTLGFTATTDGEIDLSTNKEIISFLGNGTDQRIIFGDADEMVGWANGVIVSNYNTEKQEWEHNTCKLLPADQIDWFSTDTVVVPSYMANANRITSNNAYTEQSDSSDYPPYNSSLNAAYQAIIASPGYTQRTLNLEGNNSYGPIPEGNLVQMFLTPANGATIDTSSLRVLAGETAVTDVRVSRIADGSVFIAFNLQNGSTQSVTYNVTFNGNLNPAYDDTERQYGFRVAISKVQA